MWPTCFAQLLVSSLSMDTSQWACSEHSFEVYNTTQIIQLVGTGSGSRVSPPVASLDGVVRIFQ